MATYKVLQDIEAEDKLIGPLSFRQAVYAAIVIVSGFIAFKLALVAWWLAVPFLPHMILFGMLAAPFGHDQPSEVWLLAKIRFALKPRRRIWDQTGASQLVTITVPKRIERALTDNLTQTEVRSRLQALANTIDSRGWAIKNVNVNLYAQPGYVTAGNSDRLVDPGMLPQEVSNFDAGQVTDMMDAQTNPTAQHLDQLITASEQAHRQAIIATMQQASTPAAKQATTSSGQPADYWFLNGQAGQQVPVSEPGYAVFDHNPLVAPGQQVAAVTPKPTAEEEAFLAKHHEEMERTNPMHSHLKTIEPLSAKKAGATPQAAPSTPKTSTPAPVKPVTAPTDPAILGLANNDDLNVATLARQANKVKAQELSDGEVVISLH